MALSFLSTARNKVASILPALGTDDAKLVADLDDLLSQAKEARRPYEGQWLLNLAFFMGKQWTIWSNALQALDKPSVEPWRVMPNVNYVRPAVLTAYAKIIRERQAARTQPAGTDAENEAAARACDRLLDYQWAVSKSEDTLKKATIWMLIAGTGFVKVCWDRTYGPVVGQDPTTGEDLHLGEVQTYPVSPFDFYGEPGATEIDEMEWCFHVTIRPASWVKKMYGIDVKDEDYDSNMTFESQLRQIITGDSSKTRGAVVKEFFRRPTKDYPDGQFIVYVNDQIVPDQPPANPYKDDLPLPFIPLRATPRPDSLYGASFVDDMIDPQRILNKTFGEALEIQRTMSKPKWKRPIGSMPEGHEISNAPGEDIPYTPISGLGPEPIKGVDIPTGYFKVIDQAKGDLFETSGQHEVSHGQSPYTRTAAGIAYLQEQDDSRLAPMIRNYDRAFEIMEEAKLDLAREYYPEARTIQILGQDNKVEEMVFYKDQIPNDVHVHIQAGGQALPRSRVARQDLILKLWTTQPPLLDDPQTTLKLLEFGEVEGVYETFARDISQAGKENAAILAMKDAGANILLRGDVPGMASGPTGGVPAPASQPNPMDPNAPMVPPTPGAPGVRTFHNHLVHIKEHNKVRNSSAYDSLDPGVQAAFDQHVNQHQQMYAAMLQNMQANMQAHQAATASSLHLSASGGQTHNRQVGTGLGHLAEPAQPAGQFSAGQPGGNSPQGGGQ